MPILYGVSNVTISRAMEPQSYLKVIKTNNVAKVRNEAVDIVDFLPECGEGVINLSVGVNSNAFQ